MRSFLENPADVLQRVREQFAADKEGENLQERLARDARRLTTKQEEKSRYVKLYAQGYVDEEELEVHLADLKNQVENLKMLIGSVETDLATKHENRMVAARTEVWLMGLRKNLAEVGQDTEEAFEKRRELVKLLVQKIAPSRDEDGRTRVDIKYRFGPPTTPVGEEYSADGRLNSVRLGKAHPSRQTCSSREGTRA